jgi:CRISPR/Cas system CSM-associated protein Csm3 (group 7 of RAMP superfamily)
MTYKKVPLGVAERLVVTGTLVFTSPVLFQEGSAEGLTDFVILRDEFDNTPLLPGASLAGALRSYLYDKLPAKDPSSLDHSGVDQLFGSVRDKVSERSWLIVEEAKGEEAGVETRDGVKIDPSIQTAEDKGKYDMELLSSGTSFDIGFELLIPFDSKYHPEVLRILFYAALTALENGHIHLGAKKNRGFGQCKVEEWHVHRFLMNNMKDIVRWLKDDRANPEISEHLYQRLGFSEEPKLPTSETLSFRIELGVQRSMMIRSYSTDPKQPDSVHMRNSRGDMILPGTSIAGVLRAQARRIAKFKLGSESDADNLVNAIFGSEEPDEKGRLKGSRLVVSESKISCSSADIIQNRIKIDAFTGGTYPGALFNEIPAIGGTTEIRLDISRPSDAEAALLLLLVRDLWEGMLSIGGESSIGRGFLTGITGGMQWKGHEYTFTTSNGLFSLDADPAFTDKLLAALQPIESEATTEQP